MYDFHWYGTTTSFHDNVCTRKANIVEAEENQNDLINNIVKFNNKSRPRSKEHHNKKR